MILSKAVIGLAALVAAAMGPGQVSAQAAHPAPAVHTAAWPSASTGTAPGAGPVTHRACTRNAASPQEARAAKPGDVVCLIGNFANTRLTIDQGGTAGAPITYAGNGQSVFGITVTAGNVVVDGYTVPNADAPAISMTGNNITLQNNTVTHPQGGDGDGLRFFGNDLKILHNTISGTDNSTGAHADCMQTFATDGPGSQRVLIDGNRCEQIDNMCVIAEGPNSLAGDGSGQGQTSDITVSNNFCETLQASQALMFDDVQNLTITGNTFAAGPDHAMGLQNLCTGAHVSGDTVDPSIHYEVGIDDSSMPGYQGPTPGGAP